MRFAWFVLLAASAATASGPTAALFGVVAEDRRPFEASSGYGAEGRFGWALIDAVAFEAAAGFTRSTPQSWLLHFSAGPRLAFFSDAPVSPYVRANVGVGARTPPAPVACPSAFGSQCPPPRAVDADWTLAAGTAGGAEIPGRARLARLRGARLAAILLRGRRIPSRRARPLARLVVPLAGTFKRAAPACSQVGPLLSHQHAYAGDLIQACSVCRSCVDSSVHFFPTSGDSLAFHSPPRSTSEATMESRK
jgi:hypothetical protein